MLKIGNNNFSLGFTLAEVLITLGIIGVVAVITIPLLIQNTNSQRFITQFKKSLSTLNQAAINAQAQYDINYSLLNSVNQDSSCATDALANGQDTLCGLLNNTLSWHTYQGKYGVVKGENDSSLYQAAVSSFPINDFLIIMFADGAFVAFNPNAMNCSLPTGNVLSTEILTSGNLSNCLGFIDVNGLKYPNKEVQCADVDTELATSVPCKVTRTTMGDIFPIVFHDGVVEPITNASLFAINGGDVSETVAQEPQKTAAQLAADRVDDPFQKSILNNLDAAKAAALQMYNDHQDEIEAIVANDGHANNHGMPNIAIYTVSPKLDGTFEIELYRVNVDTRTKDADFSYPGGRSWDAYRVFVQGNNVYSDIRLKEVDGKTVAYRTKYVIYLNQFHTTTPESNNFDF